MNDAPPLLIGYDGSQAARRAVTGTGELFGSRPVLVVTVWEPAMELHLSAQGAAGAGMAAPLVDSERTDDTAQTRAHRIAADGAGLARSVGLEAEALALPAGNVAETLVELANERRAPAIVVGSRGLRGLRARLEGSTSAAVVKHSGCPVVVVHDD